MRPPQPRLPIDPLVRRYDNNVSALARALGCHHSHVFRWKREGGIPLDSADRTAVSLGMHPVEVWPDWYELDAAA